MDDKIIILLVYGVPLLLYIWYKLKHRKPTVIFTPELDRTLEKIEEIRQQLNSLERLQTEMDIANLDNCFARSIAFDWGDEADEYVFELVGNDTSDLQNLIDKERVRLTTSLAENFEKIPPTVKSKGTDKTKISVGERGAF